MDIALLYNPIAGRGKSAAFARRLSKRLSQDGHTVQPMDVGPGSAKRDLTSSIAGANALVVVGGDGTVHHCVDACTTTGVPLYHVPAGTENLFARAFKMNTRYATLARALRNKRIVHADAGVCNGTGFMLMGSVGYDANVVHRLARERTGAITHLSYLPHMLLELLSPAKAPISVRVDSKLVVDNKLGTVIVANSREYACRLDPAARASMTDGQLDVTFLHHRTRVGLLRRMAASRIRIIRNHKDSVFARGSKIEIESHDRPLSVQLDGDAAMIQSSNNTSTNINTNATSQTTNAMMTPLTFSVRPGVLPVLAPTA